MLSVVGVVNGRGCKQSLVTNVKVSTFLTMNDANVSRCCCVVLIFSLTHCTVFT